MTEDEIEFGQVYEMIPAFAGNGTRFMVIARSVEEERAARDGWVMVAINRPYRPLRHVWEMADILLDPKKYRRLDDGR